MKRHVLTPAEKSASDKVKPQLKLIKKRLRVAYKSRSIPRLNLMIRRYAARFDMSFAEFNKMLWKHKVLKRDAYQQVVVRR